LEQSNSTDGIQPRVALLRLGMLSAVQHVTLTSCVAS